MLKPILTSAALIALMIPSVAQAQNAKCAPREVVLENLATKYGESRQSMGLGANNSIVEVFASTTTGSWTITVTTAHGLTCLVASGQAFEQLADVLPAEGNDA